MVRAAQEAYSTRDRVVGMPLLTAGEDLPYSGGAGAGIHDGGAVPTVHRVPGSVSPTAWRTAPGDSVPERLQHLPVNHSPLFAPDPRPAPRTAAEAMVTAALSCLLPHGSATEPA